ncbi:AAA family ATPase [Larkinella punicea]|uniref:DUF2813 domain-containing protein n=1 Tax=Larkinella punicea TaxID=2315727 RepID=A0A368JDY8_9BACT|nr:AAA family ATPase [Larkinella punicea]RCR65465.1 DUF2813 domain-containing protein [Larkinella punicea]
MKIKKIEVKNFRLLKDISIVLENDITLIVGRNNSGKTSLTEIFCKFFESVNNKFRFEDFSISCHNEFVKSYMLYKEYEESKLNQESEDILLKKENVYKEILPSIILAIQIEYTEEDDLTSLSNFIMDLDPERKDVYIQCSYSVKDPEKLIKVFEKHQKENNIDILNFIKKNYHHFYDQKIYAIDIENIINKFEIEKRSDIEDVFTSGFIFAQRQLDDQYTDNHKRLSKGFEDFYKLNKDLKESDIRKIEISLNDVSFDIDTQYLSLFESIFDDLASFGVREGINLQKLSIKSIFDSDKVLKGNARLFYQPTGIDHLLPEGYNGLGYSNLIFIILQFISFYEAYDKRRPRPAFQLGVLAELCQWV